MTKEKFYSKYGDVIVTFSHYYKFDFNYGAILSNGDKIRVTYGGNSDVIYRFECSNNEHISIKELKPYAGSVYVDSFEIESFCEY